ncbi:hypothetical protein DITRI_Ditri02bG0010500 [Diplodiscus trichospermus]
MVEGFKSMGQPGPVAGVTDSNTAKILAIREAFILFYSSPWSMSHKIIIESDSSNAVKWVTVGLSAIFLEKLTQLQMDWRKLGRTKRWILLTSLTLGAPTGGFYVTD